MKVESIELQRIRIPLKSPFRTSFGVQKDRDILLVRMITADTEGWGECVALSEPLYSSEYVEAAQHVTENHLVPRLFEAVSFEAHQVAEILAPVSGHRMSKAALEMAALDAELRGRGTSFGSFLGSARDAVACGVSVGIMESIPELLDVVSTFLDQGYVRIKLKIERGYDFDPVRAVRERWPDILLQVDANAAYTLGDARHLAQLDAFNLLLIEQPFPEEQIRAHAELARLIRTPVCLDESIVSAQVAADAIAMQACSIVNIKAGRVGGYLEARRIHDLCAANGVPVWCGGMLETGLGRAANVALASLPGFTLPGDTSASSRYYLRDIITEPFELQEGTLSVPSRAGLGVTIDDAALKELTTSIRILEP